MAGNVERKEFDKSKFEGKPIVWIMGKDIISYYNILCITFISARHKNHTLHSASFNLVKAVIWEVA